MMEEKQIIYFGLEYVRGHHLTVRREFLIGESFTVTDVWRSKMKMKCMVDDF